MRLTHSRAPSVLSIAAAATGALLLAGPASARTHHRHGHARAEAARAEKPANPAPSRTLTLNEHDTLYSLARQAHTTVEELARLNGLKPPYTLHAGRELKLPPVPVYTVRRGDTAEAVAERFGLDEAELRRRNDLDRREKLKPGAEIELPEDARDSGRDRHAGGVAEGVVAAAGSARAPTLRGRRDEEADEPQVAAQDRHGRKDRRGRREDAAQAAAEPARTARKGGGADDSLSLADIAAGVGLPSAASPHRRAAVSERSPSEAAASRGELAVPVAAPPPASSAPEPSPAPVPTYPAAVARAEPAPAPAAREPAALPSHPIPYSQLAAAGSHGRSASSHAGGRWGRTEADARGAVAAAAIRHPEVASIPPNAVADLAAGRGRFIWPVRGQVLSGFGPKGEGLRNDGLDLAAQPGDPVHASAAGEVVYAGGAIPGYGNLVLIKHPGGWVTAYGHLSHIRVAMRQTVSQGEVVGEAGQTGAVDRPELHFEIRYSPSPDESARPVDPAPLLPAPALGAG